MSDTRIDTLCEMLTRNPSDPRIRFGLATEYEKHERWEDVVKQLSVYLELSDDQGNAYGRLARALLRLGRDDEAREAYHRGIQAANRNGHPSMAAEFEDELAEL